MTRTIPFDQVNVATLVPTKGRVEVMKRFLQHHYWLNNSDTFVGVETEERESYGSTLNKVTVVEYSNPNGSIGYARDCLRNVATKQKFHYYVITDDNARFKINSFTNLVQCVHEFPEQPAVASGYHGFMEFSNRGKDLPDLRCVNGIHSYEGVAAIFLCVPHQLYREFKYPHDTLALEDRYFAMWCFSRGHLSWRVCMDAPFTKPRYAPGGSGSVENRQRMVGLSIARLALDFPLFMGAGGTIRTPWRILMAMARGKNFTKRAMYGSMKSDEHLLSQMKSTGR